MTLINCLIYFYNLNHISWGLYVTRFIIFSTNSNIFLLGKIVFNLILASAFNIIVV